MVTSANIVSFSLNSIVYKKASVLEEYLYDHYNFGDRNCIRYKWFLTLVAEMYIGVFCITGQARASYAVAVGLTYFIKWWSILL